ncbi:hypothetical protein [Lentzea jiangxiensis]|uniref:Uncharacterized protein n=1 Tax=Lentzea jiangxiensis TaxID=641025 RepID=A0A1H0UM07_9PSEU|nr:hypothetical protein [Lentzea jiangxiensis]SDP67229.1 hypothetical protein SAMN05421507_112109 [Lentzea jiangxiensis]
MPIEQQQSGSAEPETQVFAKISTEETDAATIPGVTPVTPAPPAPAVGAPAVGAPVVVAPPAAAAPAHKPKSLTRRLARRILGPTLMTKR